MDESVIVTLTLDVKVTDAGALWRKAAEYMASVGDLDPAAVLGQPTAPNVGACLAMLLDRSDLLDGAEVQQHAHDWSPDTKEPRYPNGAPMFRADGMMLDDRGERSIFDDIDE